ncbi:hypothetical protein EDD16DRAFT_1532287 [Pisolithus croceorrhizus]|nr:hypothetical protein EV401DRAFT_1920571 [Pisolithus croceorrhizus]KAI6132473.1 hypothetical protein EDD16DRAFT_1532287 [Pisolithus croceorrhizus]KAI6168798.1 hypothetical protein EDD17DRAFT_1530281 [Pisolithus thermaeus]
MSVNAYDLDECGKFVKALYLCCDEMYEKGGKDASLSACSMHSAVERWLKRYTDVDP